MRIKAFTLRKKTSKAGKVYYIAPYGNVDLLGFVSDASGDIEVSYVERDVKPVQGPIARPQAAARPAIQPRQMPPKIIPRNNPPQQTMEEPDPEWLNEPMPDEQY